jgi:hypothetical protein
LFGIDCWAVHEDSENVRIFEVKQSVQSLGPLKISVILNAPAQPLAQSQCILISKKVKILFFQIIFMLEDSNSLDPLCIILVKPGAHGGNLLFRYPISSNLYKLHLKRYSLCPDNFCRPAQPEGQYRANIKDGQLDGLSDERFVGHPVSLEPDASCESLVRKTTITMFHIVFALSTVGS